MKERHTICIVPPGEVAELTEVKTITEAKDDAGRTVKIFEAVRKAGTKSAGSPNLPNEIKALTVVTGQLVVY